MGTLGKSNLINSGMGSNMTTANAVSNLNPGLLRLAYYNVMNENVPTSAMTYGLPQLPSYMEEPKADMSQLPNFMNTTPATSNMAPQGLTMDQIAANPEAYANMDFSNYEAGSLGTDPSTGLGDWWEGLGDWWEGLGEGLGDGWKGLGDWWKGLDGETQSNLITSGLGAGLGIGQTLIGMDQFDKMFDENQKTAKSQRGLIDEQAKDLRKERAAREATRSALAGA